MVHAAQREHLRPVFRCGDVAHHLATAAHRRLFGAQPAVRIDLHLEAAVAEDAFRHHSDHIHPFMSGRDDEGGGFVVGIGRRGAYAGHEHLGRIQQPASACVGRRIKEGHHLFVHGEPALQDQHGVQPYQFAALIGVAVAGTHLKLGDLA